MTGPVASYQLSWVAVRRGRARRHRHRTRAGTVRFASAEEAVATELDAAPLGARIDPDTRRRVLEDGVAAIGPFVVDGGRVELPIRGHLVTAVAPG